MDVRERIRGQLDAMFTKAPQNRAAWELQEELLANCMERYEDLVKQGMDEEQALNSVMGSIGNVDELIAALPGEDGMVQGENMAETRKKSAMLVSIAVGLYVLAGAVFFIGVYLGGFFFDEAVLLGLVAAAILCIAPTCMLVYNANRWPSYKKNDDTVVENFKEWNSDTQKTKSVRKAITSLIWTITLVVYFLVSFLTFAWHLTWIIFLVAACLEAVVNLIFRLRELN